MFNGDIINRNDLEKCGFRCAESGHGIAVYALDPQMGDGTCCFYRFHDLFVLVQAGFTYRRDMSADFFAPPCLFFWRGPDGAIRCYTGIGEERHARFPAQTPFSVTALALSPSFYAECLRLLPEDARPKLDRALQLLDGGVSIPEASGVMRQAEAMSPARSGAGLFYEAKIKELLSYVLRWYEDSDRTAAISVEDRQAVVAVMDHLRENLSAPLSVEACTRIACMGKSKLSDLFRRMNGRSLSDYFLALRMERAKELLLGSTRTISEISRMVGFQKQTSFSTAFKAYAGVSPHDYRKRLAYDYNTTPPNP